MTSLILFKRYEKIFNIFIYLYTKTDYYMSYTQNQLRDFSSLFSRNEIYRWLKDDFRSIDLKLNRYNILEKNRGNSYLNVLKMTYKLLEEYYPNEYILKNEFLNHSLIKELRNSNSVIFNEFRIGKAIADLAIFNGISKVFEIKTILDKEYRLSNQLYEYKKLFNEIYIIIPKVQLSKYISYDKSIGVITYDSTSKIFYLAQEAERNNIIDSKAIMEVLHTREYLKIARSYFQELPEMNAFTQFEICKSLISKIPQQYLNKLFLETMKERNKNNLFFNKLNNEFNQVCLSLNLKQSERDNLILKLKINKV